MPLSASNWRQVWHQCHNTGIVLVLFRLCRCLVPQTKKWFSLPQQSFGRNADTVWMLPYGKGWGVGTREGKWLCSLTLWQFSQQPQVGLVSECFGSLNDQNLGVTFNDSFPKIMTVVYQTNAPQQTGSTVLTWVSNPTFFTRFHTAFSQFRHKRKLMPVWRKKNHLGSEGWNHKQQNSDRRFKTQPKFCP